MRRRLVGSAGRARRDLTWLKRRTPTAKTAGVRRRVIEGEGLGGFARRFTLNVAFGALFRSRLQIFLFPPIIVWFGNLAGGGIQKTALA
jgi:hypothetical protein